MAKKRVYVKIGYWSDERDVDYLMDKDADYIANYIRMGAFHETTCEEIIENPLLCDDYETMEITADKSNLVRKDDEFIDLYELREVED